MPHKHPSACSETDCCSPAQSYSCIQLATYFFECCETRTYIYVSSPDIITEIRVNGQVQANPNANEWGGMPNNPTLNINGKDITGTQGVVERCGINCPTWEHMVSRPDQVITIPAENCRYFVEVDSGGETSVCEIRWCLPRQVHIYEWDYPGYTLSHSCTSTNDEIAGGLVWVQTHELEIGAVSMPELYIDYCISHPGDRTYLLSSNWTLFEAFGGTSTWNGGASTSTSYYTATYNGKLYLTIPGYESCRAFGGNYYEYQLTFVGTVTRTTTSTSSGPGTDDYSYSGSDEYEDVMAVGRIWIHVCGGLNIGEVIWWWFFLTQYTDDDNDWNGCVLTNPVIEAIGRADWC